jgi:hypothetical protein
MDKITWVEKARRASGMTQVMAGEVTGMTNVTYGRKEKDPTLFTMLEWCRLRGAMPPESQALMDRGYDEMKEKFFAV